MIDPGRAARTGEERSGYPLRGLGYLRLAYCEIWDWSLIRISCFTVVGLAVVFAIMGPIGIVPLLDLGERLVFWTTCAALCWPVCHALTGAILYLTRSCRPVVIALAAAGGAGFLTVPFTAVGYTVYGLLNPEGVATSPLAKYFLNVAVLAVSASSFVHYVACQRVKLRLAAGSGAVAGVEEAPASAWRAAAPRLEPSARAFFDRLPEHLGRDVIYLNVSGHYLQVVTTGGSCLVLMRLSDAVLALGGLGLQVHRSYWVAYRHIEGVVRRGQGTLVRLSGGHDVPVSRTHLASVRAATEPAT